ncbi:MAG: hypothetical protein K2L12_03835 [Clostridia bacterium]|nr:hypothetical protein [Clostridia bacterium]
MKIKKKTSLMMVAASTAAIVGIAAVSFAAWTGSYQDSITASASVGSLNTFGFGDVTSVELKGEDNTSKLVPWDQNEATVNEGNYIISANLPAYTVYAEDYTITVTSAKVQGTNITYELYGQLVDKNTTVTAPTKAADLADWTSLDGDGIEVSVTNTTAGNVAAGEKVLYVILVSNGQLEQSVTLNTINVVLTSESYSA